MKQCRNFDQAAGLMERPGYTLYVISSKDIIESVIDSKNALEDRFPDGQFDGAEVFYEETFRAARQPDTQLVRIWSARAQAADKAEQAEQNNKDADRAAWFITSESRQQEAFEWCHIYGFNQDIAAERMGIGRQAVSKLLKHYFERHPDHHPKAANSDIWKPKPLRPGQEYGASGGGDDDMKRAGQTENAQAVDIFGGDGWSLEKK